MLYESPIWLTSSDVLNCFSCFLLRPSNMDSRCESGAASKSKKVRFRCDQTRQFRVVAGRGVGSFVQAKRIRRELGVARTQGFRTATLFPVESVK